MRKTEARSRSTIEAWRLEYNTERPHNPLEDLTPGTSVALTAQSVRLRRKNPPGGINVAGAIRLARGARPGPHRSDHGSAAPGLAVAGSPQQFEAHPDFFVGRLGAAIPGQQHRVGVPRRLGDERVIGRAALYSSRTDRLQETLVSFGGQDEGALAKSIAKKFGDGCGRSGMWCRQARKNRVALQ